MDLVLVCLFCVTSLWMLVCWLLYGSTVMGRECTLLSGQFFIFYIFLFFLEFNYVAESQVAVLALMKKL